MNFSFAGCGFLGIYHVGVAACLKKYAPNLLLNKCAGASAGALAAVCLLCDGPLGLITSSVLKTATEARKLFLGPFSPTFNVEKLLRDGLLSVLPEDAHERVNGKLFISVTRVCDGKNVLLSHFESREELIQALLCSAFIPWFSGWTSGKVKGVRYVDGGFSDNLPQLDVNTVTVSPFCGEADICPKDPNAGLVTISLANTSIELSKENLYRFSLILYPPPPKVLNRMCQQGFNDALEFLQRNYLINCTRCLAVHSTFNMEEKEEKVETVINVDDTVDTFEINCVDCQIQREEAILDELPEAVKSILQEAIEKANKGLMNWVFKHKHMKFVSILTLPYVIPAEVVYATFVRIIYSVPTVQDVKSLAHKIIQLLRALIRSWVSKPHTLPHHHHPRHHLDNNFSCQLAITEFSGENDAQRIGDKQRFEFSVDMVDGGTDLPLRRDSLNSESEMLNQLAQRYARSMGRRGSVTLSTYGASLNPSRAASRAASRAVSRAVSRYPSCEDLSAPNSEWSEFPHCFADDTFDQILDVTNHQDALMAYYYMDDNNEMKVTEIFDMTEATEPNQNYESDHAVHDHHLGLSEGVLKSHLDSFKEIFGYEMNLERRRFSYSSCRSTDRESVVSDPEADQHINK